jgi:hypothetical protein
MTYSVPRWTKEFDSFPPRSRKPVFPFKVSGQTGLSGATSCPPLPAPCAYAKVETYGGFSPGLVYTD